jgi:hypothetical protein
VFRRLDPARALVGGRFGFGRFHLLYALILVPSALWLPLTFAMLEAPSGGLWLAIRVTLALVGLGSLGLMAAIASALHDAPAPADALVGAPFFLAQTAVCDALVWPGVLPVGKDGPDTRPAPAASSPSWLRAACSLARSAPGAVRAVDKGGATAASARSGAFVEPYLVCSRRGS